MSKTSTKTETIKAVTLGVIIFSILTFMTYDLTTKSIHQIATLTGNPMVLICTLLVLITDVVFIAIIATALKNSEKDIHHSTTESE